MEFHVKKPGGWQVLSEWATQTLALDPERSHISFYQGMGPALVEVCVGLTKLYPLKKKIYYFKEQSFYFDGAIIQLAREGYKVVPLALDTLKNPEEWAAKIEREDLFVLYAKDETFLGKIYDAEKFETTLKDKNLIKICVSHARHFFEPPPPSPDKNTIQLFSLKCNLTLAFFGERCRVGSIVTDQLVYPELSELEGKGILNWYKKPHALHANAIQDFEDSRVADFQPYFKKGDSRLFDRSVIYWTDMDGSAFCERLTQEWNAIKKLSDTARYLQSPGLSRWGSLPVVNHLGAHGLLPEMTRGLVILSYELLQDLNSLTEAFKKVRASILKDQNG